MVTLTPHAAASLHAPAASGGDDTATIQALFDAASAGDLITFQPRQTYRAIGLTVAKSLTLELNGSTIQKNANGTLITISADDVTVQNGVLKDPAGVAAAATDTGGICILTGQRAKFLHVHMLDSATPTLKIPTSGSTGPANTWSAEIIGGYYRAEPGAANYAIEIGQSDSQPADPSLASVSRVRMVGVISDQSNGLKARDVDNLTVTGCQFRSCDITAGAAKVIFTGNRVANGSGYDTFSVAGTTNVLIGNAIAGVVTLAGTNHVYLGNTEESITDTSTGSSVIRTTTNGLQFKYDSNGNNCVSFYVPDQAGNGVKFTISTGLGTADAFQWYKANFVTLLMALDAAGVLRVPAGLKADAISEYTAAAGVTIDGLLIKDKILGASGENLGFFGTTAAARPSAYTQTYATADRTHPAMTFAAEVSTAAATNISPYGYSQTQADAIVSGLNALRTDVINLKKLVNSMLDDLQTLGLLQ